MCALSLPMGLSENGLPLGVQVAAGPYEEEMTLQVGATVEHEVLSIFEASWLKLISFSVVSKERLEEV